jgi:uncharacterized membrane protein HdeD (DUF308 family)
MLNLLSKYWWLVLLRGIWAILFGVAALAWPGLTIATLVIFFGAYALVAGVFAVVAAIAGRKDHEDWVLLVLQGGIGIAVGALTLRSPGTTALALVLFIAAWALVTGVLEVVSAIRLRKEIKGEFWLALSGIASIVLAFLLISAPEQGALVLVLWLGIWALIMGSALVVLSLRLRGRAAAKPA